MGYATYFVNVSYCAEFHHSLVCRMEHSGKGPFANGLAFIILILSDNILPRSLQWRERAQIKVEEHVMCEDAAVQQDLIHCTYLGGISLMCEEWHLATKQTDWLTRREIVRVVLAYPSITAHVSFTFSGISRIGTLHSTLLRICKVIINLFACSGSRIKKLIYQLLTPRS